MEMSTEERLVLCVLRHANQIAQSASDVSRLTGLDRPAVEFLLRRLIAMGLCERGSIQGRMRYSAVSLSVTPILSDPLEWLASYCSRPIEVEEGDSEAATYEMCGIVLLVAMVTGTREPAVIAELTGLPADFAGIVIELCHRLDLWWSERFFELERTIREQGDDAEEVADALQCVREQFWMSWVSPSVAAVLHSSRGHMQYGGAKDAWASVGGQVDKTPKRLELVKR
jgi:DNA-binding MarR family transcriptional regulator